MVQILERPQSSRERFMDSFRRSAPMFEQAFSQAMLPGQTRKEDEAIQRLTGEDVSGLSPDLKKIFLQRIMGKKEEKRNVQETFTPILEELKSLKENVGPIVSAIDKVNPYSEGAGKRSQIGNLRLSLEGLFRDLTLKGQFPKAIYERILKELPSPSDTESQYLGKITAIEKILQSHMGDTETKSEPAHNQKKSKEPLVRMQTKEGRIFRVPKDQVKAAIEAGGQVIR